MKKLYFLLFFAFSFIANAQIVNIPDANFKAKLLSANSSNSVAMDLSYNYFKIDSNNDGEIQISEVQNVSRLNVSGSSISDLIGIEYFINLGHLDCSFNQLMSINTSQMVQLGFLDCSNNLLTNLDVSPIVDLYYLNCSNNQLTSLDLTQNTILSDLDCSFNQLTTLDIMQTILGGLYCQNNQLINLLIKKNGPWDYIDFSSNPDIQYVCTDDFNVTFIQSKIDFYGYTSTCHVNSYCSFIPNGTFYEILGDVKFDFNNNGCDVDDVIYPNLKFNITNGTDLGTFIANTSGDFYIPIQAGIHTITPVLENPTYFTISPSSFVVNFPSQVSPFTQNFCVSINPHSDVEIVLVPTIPARPGFEAFYRIIYKNIGNQVENGEVTFAYEEDVLDFISSSTIYDSQTFYNNTTTLHWNYSNLMPFETRRIDVVLNVNSPMETPAVNIGDVLGIFSEISTTNTDEDLSNNSSGLRQVVVGSYDPNDKTCVEGETVDVATVGKYIHYVIRFENTGTYPAQNIVVKDMIDTSKFDISTLVPLHGSHEFFTRIKDNKVEFIFENINLDFNDATNDGYVVFKIKTLPTLILGQTFSNDANIYFDYNFPIITNEYVTTIQNVLSNQDFAFEN